MPRKFHSKQFDYRVIEGINLVVVSAILELCLHLWSGCVSTQPWSSVPSAVPFEVL